MGKVFGVHAIDLKPGVTEADLEAHFRDSRFVLPGTTLYLAKGDRGARSGQYAVIVEFESAELRARYFPGAGTVSDEYTQRAAPFEAEVERFGNLTTFPDHANYTAYHVMEQLS